MVALVVLVVDFGSTCALILADFGAFGGHLVVHLYYILADFGWLKFCAS